MATARRPQVAGRGRGPAAPLNLHELHRYFWRNADQRHRLLISQKALAADLGVHPPRLSIIIGEMVAAGRLRKVGFRDKRLGVYQIADPDRWDPDNPDTHAQAHRDTQWG